VLGQDIGHQQLENPGIKISTDERFTIENPVTILLRLVAMYRNRRPAVKEYHVIGKVDRDVVNNVKNKPNY